MGDLVYLDEEREIRENIPISYMEKMGKVCQELELIDYWEPIIGTQSLITKHCIRRPIPFLNNSFFSFTIAEVISEPRQAKKEHADIKNKYFRGFCYEGLKIKVIRKYEEEKIKELGEKMAEFLNDRVEVQTIYF